MMRLFCMILVLKSTEIAMSNQEKNLVLINKQQVFIYIWQNIYLNIGNRLKRLLDVPHPVIMGLTSY